MYLEKPVWFFKNFLKFLLCIILLGACSKGTFHSIKPIPTIQFEVPKEIKNNNEAMNFIQQTTESLNIWAERFNTLHTEQQTLLKRDSERTIYQHVRLVSLSENCVNQRQRFILEHEQIHERAKLLSMQMNQREHEAFAPFIVEIVQFKENVLHVTNPSITYSQTRH